MSAALPPDTPREVSGLASPAGGKDDSIETLMQRTAGLCAGAVDTLEVAAGLEMDGVNDEGAARYGYPDVFALAEDLYERTERSPLPAVAPPNPWRPQVWRHLLRGMLFGLPGLCYATVGQAVARPGAGIVLIVSLLLSWPVSQGVAYLSYLRFGRDDRAAALRLMRRSLSVGGALLLPIIAVTGILLHAGVVTVLAAAQCIYLLAATVALVSGAELWLLLALLPGVTMSTVQLAAGGDGWPVGWIAWVITIGATVGLAVVRTSTADVAPGEADGGRLSWGDVRAALPHALFGLLAGGLLTFTAVSALLGRSSLSNATTVSVLALSLSMGFAEWILISYRRMVHRLLLGQHSVWSFMLAARATLTAAVVAYLGALIALVGTVMAIAIIIGHFPPAPLSSAGLAGPAATWWIVGSHICLGGAFFVALILQSCGRIPIVLAGCAGALGAEVLATLITGPGPAQLMIQGTTACGLFGALSAFAFVVLGRATSHR